ncbi:acylphosphatase [Oceanobacillus halophilus]|uniref:Acylphosphatase n=1 Tax=Oceanobacillus halophilus TaxID=930130 RepID=A0A495ACD5_9BACI|nr:acylphosphatase [Oceanobacillus halophilus]RKQ37608.1 acylphosphatase [Oceanobacillus halophilus]
MNKHVLVSGRVQGVGFRYSVQRIALQQNIKGWVRNNPDGKVELEVEGRSEDVHTFLKKMNKGLNPFIRMDEIDVLSTSEDQGYKNFSIKY